MLVKDWMNTDVHTLNATASIQDAVNVLMEHHVDMIPVLSDGKLVGVVTDRDVKHALPSDACLLDFQNIMYHVARVELCTIMSPNPITVQPDLTLEETAEILLNNNISGVPVVDAAGALLGTIDKDELFAALVALSGLSHKGHLFAFELEDRAGSIKEVSDIIRKYGGRLVSVVSSYETAPEGKRHVYVRAFGLDPVSAGELEEELKNAAHLLYVVDHQEGRRKFF